MPNVISFLFCIEMVLVVAGQSDGYFAFDVADVGKQGWAVVYWRHLIFIINTYLNTYIQ